MGCDISGMSSTAGYQANIYSYKAGDTADFSRTDYYLSSYAAGGPITSGFVADPQFISTNNALGDTKTIGSLEVPISNFAMELTGYFYGMLHFSAELSYFFSLQSFFILLTNT